MTVQKAVSITFTAHLVTIRCNLEPRCQFLQRATSSFRAQTETDIDSMALSTVSSISLLCPVILFLGSSTCSNSLRRASSTLRPLVTTKTKVKDRWGHKARPPVPPYWLALVKVLYLLVVTLWFHKTVIVSRLWGMTKDVTFIYYTLRSCVVYFLCPKHCICNLILHIYLP